MWDHGTMDTFGVLQTGASSDYYGHARYGVTGCLCMSAQRKRRGNNESNY